MLQFYIAMKNAFPRNIIPAHPEIIGGGKSFANLGVPLEHLVERTE